MSSDDESSEHVDDGKDRRQLRFDAEATKMLVELYNERKSQLECSSHRAEANRTKMKVWKEIVATLNANYPGREFSVQNAKKRYAAFHSFHHSCTQILKNKTPSFIGMTT